MQKIDVAKILADLPGPQKQQLRAAVRQMQLEQLAALRALATTTQHKGAKK